MKILHITFSKLGGAGIATHRLNDSLNKKKIKSQIFFFDKFNKTIVNKKLWIFHVFLKKILVKFFSSLKKKNSISLNLFENFDISKLIKQTKPDLVHLHWIGNEMMSMKQISKINKPLVWTMLDMWPFTGCEHYTFDKRFISGYNSNNRPNFENGLDLDRLVWNSKVKYLNKKNINIICPSRWVKRKIDKSSIFKSNNKFIFPTLIDHTKWKILPKKKKFNSSSNTKNKTVIFFSATSSVNYRKGFSYLVEAIDKYLDKENFLLLVAGSKPLLFENLSIEKKFLGEIDSQKKLNEIYCKSDIFVVPSILEVLGQVFIEAGMCGIPSVAFNNTGVADIIEHKSTGYLSKFRSSKDLAKGIIWCKEKMITQKSLPNKIRKKTIKKFSYKANTTKLIKIYQKVINL